MSSTAATQPATSGATPVNGSGDPEQKRDKVVSYMSLPNKKQLAILCLARLVDPLLMTSIQSYMFYQLKFFDPSASDATISFRAGVIVSTKTVAQVCTGVLWGRVADSDFAGRKTTLIIGSISSCIASIGYGFSTTFPWALAFQAFGGAMSCNVALIRCVISELNPEKRYRVRALMLLPLFANVGMLVGPLIGGLLTLSPGPHGFHKYPYALPNVLIAVISFVAATGIFIAVPETLVSLENRTTQTLPQRIWRRVKSLSNFHKHRMNPYRPVPTEDPLISPESSTSGHANGYGTVSTHSNPVSKLHNNKKPYKLPFRSMWTFNVICTLLSHFAISGHLGTFQSLWAVFLSTPRRNSKAPVQFTNHNSTDHSLFFFNGGLGLPARDVGFAMALLGLLGVIFQILVYPRLNDRFGALLVWQCALFIFPFVYLVAPYPSLISSLLSNLPESSHILVIWITTSMVSLFFTLGRSGVTPATTLLINECTPHPSVRGTIHTSASMMGNLSRSIFPLIAFSLFSKGLKIGVVGLGFWTLALLALLACAISRWVREGSNGNDIVPPNETDFEHENDGEEAETDERGSSQSSDLTSAGTTRAAEPWEIAEGVDRNLPSLGSAR